VAVDEEQKLSDAAESLGVSAFLAHCKRFRYIETRSGMKISDKRPSSASGLPRALFMKGARREQNLKLALFPGLSNRELRLLEPPLTHRKQTVAPASNRELSTNQCSCNSRLTGASFPDVLLRRRQFLAGFPRASFAKGSICSGALLPGSGSQVEIAVTHSKQSTDEFLPGSRIAQLETRICAKMNAQISSQLSAQMSQIR
jgi:hypothetical protein